MLTYNAGIEIVFECNNLSIAYEAEGDIQAALMYAEHGRELAAAIKSPVWRSALDARAAHLQLKFNRLVRDCDPSVSLLACEREWKEFPSS